MKLDQALRWLYSHEINCSVSCFWDGGWDVKLGDPINGIKAECSFDRIEEVGPWLHEQALVHFPNTSSEKP